MDTQSAEAWLEAGATNSPVTIDQLDQMVKDYAVIRGKYEAQDKISKGLYKEAEEAKRKVLEAMRLTGKQKYHVDGIGLCYLKNELSVPSPKTIEAKQQLFDFIKKEYGESFLMEKLAIHSATLQRLYNESYKEAEAKGQGATFHMPGLDQPTVYQSLSFRKD